MLAARLSILIKVEMTMKNSKNVVIRFMILTLLSCGNGTSKKQVSISPGKYDIIPFEASILNSDYAMAYSVLTVLTEKQLKIIFKSDLVGEKDSVLFIRALQPSDTLKQISEIRLNGLKEYYTNQCIDDGSQIRVTFKKGGNKKTVHLSNYYHDDIGKMIYLVNSLIPEKYKVWYDKQKLIDDYIKCN